MKSRIAALDTIGLDEDRIVNMLGITHSAYHRHSARPPGILSYGTVMEVKHDTESTLAQQQQIYRATYSQIYNARYSAAPCRYYIPHPFVSDIDAIQEAVQLLDMTPQQLKRHFRGIDTTRVLRTLGLAQTTRDLVDTLIAEGTKYATIAKYLGLSEGYVKILGMQAPGARSNQGTYDIPRVLDYAAHYGIAAASKRYTISRAAIYYHRSKQHEA